MIKRILFTFFTCLLVLVAQAQQFRPGYGPGYKSGFQFLNGTQVAYQTVTSQVPLGISGTPHTAVVNTPYSYTPNVGGGNGTRSYSVSGTLPPGLNFNNTTGNISGTPTTSGTYNHTISTSTTDGQTASLASRTITVLDAGKVVLKNLFPNAFPGGTQTHSFSFMVNEAQGVKITRIQRRVPGSTLTIAPADGKVAIQDDGTTAYLVVGSTASTTTGSISYTITETHPNATNSGTQTTIAIYVCPASNAVSVASQGYKIAGMGGQVLGASLGIVNSRSRFKGYVRFKLGRANYTTCKIAFSNWRINPTSDQEELTPPDDTTVPQIYANILNAPTPSAQVLYGGTASHTFARGIDFDFSDDITPSQFGLSQFDDSTEIFIKWTYDLTGTQVAYVPATTQSGASQQFAYDPANEPTGANTTPTDVGTAGPYTAIPTGAGAGAVFGPTMLVCKQKSGDAVIPAAIIQGDSIAQRLADLPGDGEIGGGWPARGLFTTGIPYYRHAQGGRAAYHWVNNNYKSKTALLFATLAVNELAGNDLSNQSTDTDLLSDLATMYAQARAAGVTKIVGATFMPRLSAGYLASGSNVLTNYRTTDLNNQFPYVTSLVNGLGFESGGYKDKFNTAIKARVGQNNGPDSIVDMQTLTASSGDSTKFATRSFSTTLAASSTAGSNTIKLNAEPDLYEGLILEPGTNLSDGNGASPVTSAAQGGGNYPLYVIGKTNNGDGTWTVTLTRPGIYANNLIDGNTPTVAHAAGAVVRATPSMDETHPTMPIHIAASNILSTILYGYYPAYAFANSEAQSYIARYSSPPSDKFKRAIDTYVGSLKSNGPWAKLDAQYVLAAPSKQGAYLNLRSTSYTVTDGATAPTFVANKGITGNGTSAYATTNLNPTTAGGLFVQDNAHADAYVLADSSNTAFDVASQNGRLRIRSASGTATSARIGTSISSQSAVTGTTTAPRNVLINRTGPSAQALFINGTQDSTVTTASNANSTTIDLLRDTSGTVFSDRTLMLAGFGSSLTSTEANAKNAADKALLQTLGVVQ